MALGLAFAKLTLRLATGMTFVLLGLPIQRVPPGFFRVQLWIVMGLNTLAALLLAGGPDRGSAWWLTVAAAAVSYVAAVIWLYERRRLAQLVMALVTGLDGWALSIIPPRWLGDDVSSALLMGSTVTAMLLGHWYLNTPTMRLEPLRRLVLFVAGSLVLRAGWEVVGGLAPGSTSSAPLAWLALRWIVGILAAGLLSVMTWLTLRIPNTQSATGILYVAVVVVFLGESIALLQWL